MQTQEWTNEQWCQLIRASDADAWQFLYQELAVWIEAYIQQRLAWMPRAKQEEFRENCQQVAAERIWRQINQYTGKGAFLGWCRVVATRVIVDSIRAERRERHQVPVNITDESAEFLAAYNDTEAIEQAHIWEQLQRCIAQGMVTALTENEHKVIAAGPDADVPTLAQQLKVTPNSIHQFRFQARKKLCRYLVAQGFTREHLVQWGIL